jgi:hypothetical protein
MQIHNTGENNMKVVVDRSSHCYKFSTYIRRYNAKRASLVQSRIKMLEKLPVLEPVVTESTVTLRFPDVDKLSPPILMLR